ncbi:bck1-like resistance to osmotic shock [Lithohypha guttulata]|uniref:BRO domain-containing protein 1 n=1 Tax=Lithohypha guttulata TaxID=1690604 RepID=A0AAN7PJT1_9EURO|nr:bck1-like resistance to osmotic shock [Lithohypha guttulata]KAK5095827.1 bck1-like resistance to osmotic shock [Lithohypha guttulata]
MVQAPMLSSPLKQTTEIDWIEPLKIYIRHNYGDDPEKYAEECQTLNRLRQDMRGAGADSASGRDLLYRYYGQLELLDLRFPVDENHIKISFTWYDAFTHKPTSQYSLAFEKASVIFNISAVLSCHAATQNRAEDNGLKTAYHSFQASAGMFTYINENFLHAPSTDLNRDTVKTLIHLTLAQAQEIFLEKQTRDGKKPGLLAKLAAQAHFLYGQAKEGLETESLKGVFDPSWLKYVQVKGPYLTAVAEYNQALADDEAGQYGIAIARLELADKAAKTAYNGAKTFPSKPQPTSNLGNDTASALQTITKRQTEVVAEKLTSLTRDNDLIYHQTVPGEASVQPVSKLPAAKAIPVSELYQGQDIQRIIGPDIFQKIVPMSVTESASMYDEEKAKLIRSEAEKVEQANGEMAASLDYLKLPQSLNVLKGGAEAEIVSDPEFERWCSEMTNHESFGRAFEQLTRDKASVLESLAKSTKSLDMEESVCEKMRSKYGGDWTQQPSSRLTSTLRTDIKSYKDTVDQASNSDAQLLTTARQFEADFDEMRRAGENEEADVLYQQAMIKAGAGTGRRNTGENLLDEDYGEGGPSIADQVEHVEELLRKLNLVKRERSQVLKDLKDKVHNDDISNVLILNKKQIANHENQLFQAELEKFRSHQNRLISTVHKQQSLLKELTRSFGDLLQDKRVRTDQQKFENMQKSKAQVKNKYKKVFTAHEDMVQGLMRAQAFYSEMKDSVDSLAKNVEAFVNNRRAEGAQLLQQIEQNKSNAASGQAVAEQERLQKLMERMSMEPSKTPTSPQGHRPAPLAPQFSYNQDQPPLRSPGHSGANADPRFTIPPRENPVPVIPNGYQSHPSSHTPQPPAPHSVMSPMNPQSHPAFTQSATPVPTSQSYNPMAYPERNSSMAQQPQSQHYAYAQQPQQGQSQYQYHQPQAQSLPQRPPQPQLSTGQPYFQQSHTPHPQSVQSPPPLNFTSPSQQYPSFAFPQMTSPQNQYPPGQQQQWPGYGGVPQNYVPPPPPPGPPGGGSSTQYSQNTWSNASGPGGYANYQHRSQGQGQVQQPQIQPQPGGNNASGSGDPWAGLNQWK